MVSSVYWILTKEVSFGLYNSTYDMSVTEAITDSYTADDSINIDAIQYFLDLSRIPE